MVTDENYNPHYEVRYCCHEWNAVSVFDFLTPSVADILKYPNWRDCLTRHYPLTIALGFTPASVAENLIRYPEMKVRDGNEVEGVLLHLVEACHVGEIPLGLVVRYLLICPHDWKRFYIENSLTDQRIEQVAAEFRAEGERQRNEAEARGETKGVDILNALIKARRARDAGD